jgi:hypothetical protein
MSEFKLRARLFNFAAPPSELIERGQVKARSFTVWNGLELFWVLNHSINCIGLELFRAVLVRKSLTEQALSDTTEYGVVAWLLPCWYTLGFVRRDIYAVHG